MHFSQLSQMVAMSEVIVVKSSELTRVEKRVRAGKCLALVPKVVEGAIVCDDRDQPVMESCDCAAETRGLCQKHYRKFMRNLQRKRTSAERLEYLQNNIREGRILSAYGVLDITRPDPFEG